MSNLSLSVAPGYFLSAQTVGWNLSAQVDYVSFTQNGPAPAISKYIAYDTLTPPGPFLAVTQDGLGNVVYDGGFPKYYNNVGPGPGATFASLNASFKFLYNAINFTANPTKVAAGNKKVLILGDQQVTWNYAVKSTGPQGFFNSFTNLCAAAGFTPTFMDCGDFVAGKLDIRLAELEQYTCVLLLSSAGGGDPWITDGCVTDLVTFRLNGSGIIVITDDGPDFTDISQAYPPPNVARQFFVTANKLVVNFGSYFTGNYDRTPVNVGFIRATYGDHPLYAGMLDSESINAGGSESKLVLANYPKYTAANVPTLNISNNGVNTVKVIAVLLDGSIETYSFVYIIATGQLIKFVDGVGTEINGLPETLSNLANFSVQFLGSGLGTLSGVLEKNNIPIAELTFTDAGGSKISWFLGGVQSHKINKTDVLTARILSPFSFARALPINRHQPVLAGGDPLAKTIANIRADGYGANLPHKTVLAAIKQMKQDYPELTFVASGDSARNVAMLRKYFSDSLPLVPLNAYIYATTIEINNAKGRLVPPMANSSVLVMVNVALNRVLYYTNTNNWATLVDTVDARPLIAQDLFGAPRTLTNPETGKSFTLNVDGTITAL